MDIARTRIPLRPRYQYDPSQTPTPTNTTKEQTSSIPLAMDVLVPFLERAVDGQLEAGNACIKFNPDGTFEKEDNPCIKTRRGIARVVNGSQVELLNGDYMISVIKDFGELGSDEKGEVAFSVSGHWINGQPESGRPMRLIKKIDDEKYIDYIGELKQTDVGYQFLGALATENDALCKAISKAIVGGLFEVVGAPQRTKNSSNDDGPLRATVHLKSTTTGGGKGSITGYWKDGNPIGEMKREWEFDDRTQTSLGEIKIHDGKYKLHGKAIERTQYKSGKKEICEGIWEYDVLSTGTKQISDGRTLQTTYFNNKKLLRTCTQYYGNQSDTEQKANITWAANKVVYNGHVNEKHMPEGRGICTWANGNSYDGDFVNGKQHGHGTYQFSDGCNVVGKWKNGTLTSRTFANGRICTFEKWDGKFNPVGKEGTLEKPGEFLFTGAVDSKGRRHGKGCIQNWDGEKWGQKQRGKWKVDILQIEDPKPQKPHSNEETPAASEQKKDHVITKVKAWPVNKNGTIETSFGRYTGEYNFKEEMDGPGKLEIPDGGPVCYGFWSENQLMGNVQLCYSNQSVYVGSVDPKTYEPQGNGELILEDGIKYKGCWNKSIAKVSMTTKFGNGFKRIGEVQVTINGGILMVQQHGTGEIYSFEKKYIGTGSWSGDVLQTFTYADGRIARGNFNNDYQLHGQGEMWLPQENLTCVANWIDGEAVNPVTLIYSKDIEFNELFNPPFLGDGERKWIVPDGTEVEGRSENGVIDYGKLKVRFSDGTQIEGSFAKTNDFRPHGTATLTMKNGNKITGEWDKDEGLECSDVTITDPNGVVLHKGVVDGELNPI